ncbi:segregation/condensation protein A [Bifidobacterium sp. SMB2]|uniref:Segregation and condensation protein A n=1 Tax=Bifidobacterium saimiriisciurei TaxID=2661627 RepID=A0ABX0CAE3_9BIFI|nr:segregation/condensation protein A [Bifidobacterium sp. SMB2]NEH11211.1 segregation/condensation protein A [Bifidobacterium saimiriisciurei]
MSSPERLPSPAPAAAGEAVPGGFTVDLEAYQGPFDVLLGLLANKRLELTEVSLSAITEEFLHHLDVLDFERNMDEASAFIDVASVLIEAKSAALLPSDDEDEPDGHGMDALRERDLLFARLLQYRAFKQAGEDFRRRLADNAGGMPHPGGAVDVVAEPPELVWTVTPERLAGLAAHALANAPASEVSLRQLHVPLVDLRQQAAIVRTRLRSLPAGESLTFAELTADAETRLQVAARFLALLAFFKHGVVQFRQDEPYAALHLRWADHDGSRHDAAIDDIAMIDEGDFA